MTLTRQLVVGFVVTLTRQKVPGLVVALTWQKVVGSILGLMDEKPCHPVMAITMEEMTRFLKMVGGPFGQVNLYMIFTATP